MKRIIAISSLVAPLTLPMAALAQDGNGLQLFSSYNNSIPGGEGMAGAGLSLGTGLIAVRGTFAIGISGMTAPASSGSTTNQQRWTGDADVVLADHYGILSALLGGVARPYAFAGIGAQSISTSPSVNEAIKTWSYGGGVSVPLASSVSIDAEVRTRTALSAAYAPATEFVPGQEYRVGIDLHFGSGGRSYGSRSGPSRGDGGGGYSHTVWPAGNANAAGAARRVVPEAEQYIGVPYLYGGSTPAGFDCSGFVQYVYGHEGVDLPRTSGQMAQVGLAIERSAMAIGDLMLFTQGGRIAHVAIYAGSGRFIHSSSSGGGVRYDDLNTQRGQWFADHLVVVRRVATGAGAAAIAAFAKTVVLPGAFDPPDSAPPVKDKQQQH